MTEKNQDAIPAADTTLVSAGVLIFSPREHQKVTKPKVKVQTKAPRANAKAKARTERKDMEMERKEQVRAKKRTKAGLPV